jgi:hypothetical protein
MPFTPEQIDRLLNEPIYSWDVSSLLAGIVDFLEFSEGNITWQREREVRRAKQEAEGLEFEPQDAHLLPQAREQIIESAELRFDIGLSQSVRYAGLVTYVTAIEWCAKLFASRLFASLPRKPNRKNEAVHVLEYLNNKVAHRLTREVDVLRQIVFIRNCTVHAAGLVKGDKHETEIRQAVAAVPGFGLSTAGFMGETIHITGGTIERLAREALVWVPSLDNECSNNGTFKRHP